MTPDLPEELGPLEPGVEQLLRTLTSAAAPAELAGEQGAMTMFRLNVRPSAAGATTQPSPAAQAMPSPAAQAMPSPATQAIPVRAPSAGTRPMRQLRRLRASASNRFRVIGVAAVALFAGLTAAAYAAVLPAPVQHIAHDAFSVLGVPDNSQRSAVTSHNGSSSVGGAGHRRRGSPASGGAHPAPSGRAGLPPVPSPSLVASPNPSASPSTSPSAGAAVLSEQAALSQIPAGTAATVTGQLTVGGTAKSGVTIGLYARVAGRLAWHLVGQAATNAQGAVTFTTPDLSRNTRFALTDAAGAQSSVVLVTVTPEITLSSKLGPAGARDYITVSTSFAQSGDVVELQVEQNGSWAILRDATLNSSGGHTFVVSVAKQAGMSLRVVLLSTRLHASAVSNAVTVPASA
jgi:hypothetical protein